MTSTGSGRTCAAHTVDGRPCQSWATNGSAFCVAHDPAKAAQMAVARSQGGKARHGRKLGSVGNTEAVALTSLADVLIMLTEAVNEVRTMEPSVNKARCLGYLASVWADCFETSEIERRVAALEAVNHGK